MIKNDIANLIKNITVNRKLTKVLRSKPKIVNGIGFQIF